MAYCRGSNPVGVFGGGDIQRKGAPCKPEETPKPQEHPLRNCFAAVERAFGFRAKLPGPNSTPAWSHGGMRRKGGFGWKS
jgi:hypothetical protein